MAIGMIRQKTELDRRWICEDLTMAPAVMGKGALLPGNVAKCFLCCKCCVKSQ